MNFSTNYIIFPPNKALERAIANSIGMLSAEAGRSGCSGYQSRSSG